MLLLTLACASAPPDLAPTAVTTDAGLYALELLATPSPFVAGEVAELSVRVSHADGPTGDATVSLSPFMPDMGHGLSEDPPVEDRGEGEYFSTWTFPMSGLWELEIGIDGAFGEDAATVSYVVD